MEQERLYQIALTMIPDLGPVCARTLIDHFGEAALIFKARKKELASLEGMGEQRARSVREWKGFQLAEAELAFVQRHNIELLFLTDNAYPQRLLHCYDPPTLLYFKGHADLNQAKIISIIGTRNHTEYGKWVTEQLIASLQSQQVLVISGLAFGIDAIAHKSCLQYQIPTIGILAHGLHTVYPFQHKQLAKEMLGQGGLLTEFNSGTKPDKHNFPKRNRIVAGMADATIVIETAVKGGSMITAELTHSYNRDLFAIPGRLNDTKSSGCIRLIQQQKASILTGADHLVETMGWTDKKAIPRKQRQLFIDTTPEERSVLHALQEKPLAIDELYYQCGLSSSQVMSAILSLELQAAIEALPGKRYRLL